MNAPKDPSEFNPGYHSDGAPPAPKGIDLRDVLDDLRAGLRTRGFLLKYRITLAEFQTLLKDLIRAGFLTKQEFRDWKAHRLGSTAHGNGMAAHAGRSDEDSVPRISNIETYVLSEPERNHSWALALFSTQREKMKGAQFKVTLQGKKYLFVVEELIFRGSVNMVKGAVESPSERLTKRQEALDFIARHGWAAYLENRAYMANFGNGPDPAPIKAKLVLLHCRNETFLAALHTPVPAINLYVGSSLETIRRRLSKSVDMSSLGI